MDLAKLGESHIFHSKGWRVTLIVSEHLELALEEENVKGIDFDEV